jgi:glycosyltransferase A (GT-A) superfamily protein (DUF2064 family)
MFSAGYGAVCLLDSDSPNLPLAVLQILVTTLFEFEDNVVVGPCVDGGYWVRAFAIRCCASKKGSQSRSMCSTAQLKKAPPM